MSNHARTSSSNTTGQRRSRHDEQLTQEVNHLRNILVQKDKQINSFQQQMEIVMQHLSLNRYEVSPVPPANPICAGHNDERHNDVEIVNSDDDFLGHL